MDKLVFQGLALTFLAASLIPELFDAVILVQVMAAFSLVTIAAVFFWKTSKYVSANLDNGLSIASKSRVYNQSLPSSTQKYAIGE
jgi:hypothetical protein